MIYIGLGANIPNKKNLSLIDTLKSAMICIESLSLKIIEKSSFYSSAPYPMSDQPWFINSVISIETTLKPKELLNALHEIERLFGRERREKWGPRTLDLDLLTYNNLQSDKEVNLPHPRMHERAFVLYPLNEVSKNWVHPILQKNVNELIKALPPGQVVRKIY